MQRQVPAWQSTDGMKELSKANKGLRIAYVLDPRFAGGTSSAVAAELRAVCAMGQVHVNALETKMFSGRYVAPQLSDVLTELNLPLTWVDNEIAADVVIFHNPSSLKFQEQLGTKIVARHLIVVTHENFLRPGGAEGFDVEKCLDQIAASSITLKRSLAPISAWNRSTVESWCRKHVLAAGWSLLEDDWFNICSFERVPPTTAPRDRRGRHSRPGSEKFPPNDVMELCFPETAERNIILGADRFMGDDDVPVFWTLYPFGSLTLPHFFEQFDFFVYYTAPTWRESFGRVVPEAVAAGKIVITDPETANSFEGAAIGAVPQEIDQIIATYVAQPERYRADVLSAQASLDRFSADSFRGVFKDVFGKAAGVFA